MTAKMWYTFGMYARIVCLYIVALCFIFSVEVPLGAQDAKRAVTNAYGFAIYIGDGVAGRGDEVLPDVKLMIPILCDKDFVSIQTNGHGFVITRNAVRKLLEELQRPFTFKRPDELVWPDTPFILAVDGEAVYKGVFTSLRSSANFHIPRLMVIDRRLELGGTNSVEFYIEGPEKSCGDERIVRKARQLALRLGDVVKTPGHGP